MEKTTNLTLVIDDEVLRRARIRALERGTSVNAVVREYLEEYAGGSRSRDRAIDALLALSARSKSARGSARWTRDDLHDRGSHG